MCAETQLELSRIIDIIDYVMMVEHFNAAPAPAAIWPGWRLWIPDMDPDMYIAYACDAHTCICNSY